MNLRVRNYPPNFWLKLHNHTIDPLSSLPPKTFRPLSTVKKDKCLIYLSPDIQKFTYTGAIHKRKGEVKSSKFPISPEQYTILSHLGLTHKYKSVLLLEQQLKLEHNFVYKGYARGVEHIQFRLQKYKPVISGRPPILIIRIRLHQKAPVLM